MCLYFRYAYRVVHAWVAQPHVQGNYVFRALWGCVPDFAVSPFEAKGQRVCKRDKGRVI